MVIGVLGVPRAGGTRVSGAVGAVRGSIVKMADLPLLPGLILGP